MTARPSGHVTAWPIFILSPIIFLKLDYLIFGLYAHNTYRVNRVTKGHSYVLRERCTSYTGQPTIGDTPYESLQPFVRSVDPLGTEGVARNNRLMPGPSQGPSGSTVRGYLRVPPFLNPSILMRKIVWLKIRKSLFIGEILFSPLFDGGFFCC